MTQWHFYDKVFRRWIVVQLSSYQEFVDEMISSGFKEMDYIVDANGMCVELNADNNTEGQYCTFIWLKKWSTTTLVHELTHLVMMCFEQTGIPISRENTETFAFYMEYWWSEINKAYRKYPKGINPAQAKRVGRV